MKNYKNDDEKLLIAKIFDKNKLAEKTNKIVSTNFLDLKQIGIVNNCLNLNRERIKNYIFYGGFEEAERKVLIFYSEKFTKEMVEKNYDKIINVIKIDLPEETKGIYEHKNYLSAIIKLGIKREKVGDIIVDKNGADIIVSPDISEYLLQNIGGLTRFSKAKITQIDLSQIRKLEIKKEETKIIVASLRLDNIIAELAKCSRSKAVKIIESERVFINHQNQTKLTKQVKEGDLITIRGKGRFEINKIEGNTKKGKMVISVNRWK